MKRTHFEINSRPGNGSFSFRKVATGRIHERESSDAWCTGTKLSASGRSEVFVSWPANWDDDLKSIPANIFREARDSPLNSRAGDEDPVKLAYTLLEELVKQSESPEPDVRTYYFELTARPTETEFEIKGLTNHPDRSDSSSDAEHVLRVLFFKNRLEVVIYWPGKWDNDLRSLSAERFERSARGHRMMAGDDDPLRYAFLALANMVRDASN